MRVLVFVVTVVNVIPFQELSILSLLLAEDPPLSTVQLVYQTALKLVNFNTRYRKIFQEVGGVGSVSLLLVSSACFVGCVECFSYLIVCCTWSACVCVCRVLRRCVCVQLRVFSFVCNHPLPQLKLHLLLILSCHRPTAKKKKKILPRSSPRLVFS
jgi:hypothetical protein